MRNKSETGTWWLIPVPAVIASSSRSSGGGGGAAAAAEEVEWINCSKLTLSNNVDNKELAAESASALGTIRISNNVWDDDGEIDE